MNRINTYTCATCGQRIVTIDVDQGTTPMFLNCRAFEQAFLAHLVLPSGETMSQWVGPQIEQAYLSGKMPPLLLMSGE